jgi:hypothetical protein
LRSTTEAPISVRALRQAEVGGHRLDSGRASENGPESEQLSFAHASQRSSQIDTRDYLGVSVVPSHYEDPPWQQQAGPTAFAPFPNDRTYFGDDGKRWMINFRVLNLEAMISAASFRWSLRRNRF